jgi:hypothetical protein
MARIDHESLRGAKVVAGHLKSRPRAGMKPEFCLDRPQTMAADLQQQVDFRAGAGSIEERSGIPRSGPDEIFDKNPAQFEPATECPSSASVGDSTRRLRIRP